MKVFLIVLLVLCLLGLLPITFRSKLDYILTENSGVLCIYFFSIRVFIAKIFLSKNKLVIKTKKKAHTISLDSLRQGKDFKSKFIKNLMFSLKYNNVRLLSSIGLNNAMYSALGCGVIDIATGCSLSLMRGRLNIKNYSFSVIPSFLSFNAVFALSSSITFSLWIVIYDLVSSI